MATEPAAVPGAGWETRVAALWAAIDEHAADAFVSTMQTLVAELPTDDPRGPFELGSAHDSTGRSDLAVPLYRQALAEGLSGGRRRRATIQLASSLRNLGEVAESIGLLHAELEAGSDELDGAVRGFLALALTDAGREREAVAEALLGLAPSLPRYGRSLGAYAQDLR